MPGRPNFHRRPHRCPSFAGSIRSKGDLRRFYQARRKRGLNHVSAVTATALNLTRIVWRICTDQREYLPAGRPTTPATRS